MAFRRSIVLASIVVVAGLVSACSPPAPCPTQSVCPSPTACSSQAAQVTPDELKRSWTLVWWDDPAPIPDWPITIEFIDGYANGFSSCNAYTAELMVIDNRRLRVGGLSGTWIPCAPEMNEPESIYQTLLLATAGWQIEDDTLILLSYRGDMLHFTPS